MSGDRGGRSCVAAHRSRSVRLRAHGHFAGGHVVRIADRLTYVSSDPAIVWAPNDRGDRSRIRAVARGTTVVRAILAATGLATTASGGNVVVTVVD